MTMTCNPGPALRQRILSIALPVLALGVLADQASKSWASASAVEPRMLVPGYLAAYSARNPGCLLGIGGEWPEVNGVVLLLGIVFFALLVRIAGVDRRWCRAPDGLALALLLSGILGNTLDRLALGHVRDFLVIRAMPTVAFNLADLFLFAGGVLLLAIRFGDFGRARLTVLSLRRVAA